MTHPLVAEVRNRLKPHQHGFLATVDGNHPRVRPVTVLFSDNCFWISTESLSAKVQQLIRNPQIELCILFQSGEHYGYIRIAGSATIIQNLEVKTRIAKITPYFADYWDQPSDPNYTLLKIHPEAIEYLRPAEDHPLHLPANALNLAS